MRNGTKLASLVVVSVVAMAGCVLDTKGLQSETTGSGGSGGTGGMDSTSSTSSTGGSGGMGSTSSSGGTGGSGMCKDGDVQSCYSGPAGTQDVGVCKAGQAVCKGGAWSGCEGEVLPVAADDVCDGADSDCDGDDDVAEGCAAYEVATDDCQGVALIDGNMVVVEGSTPDTAACTNGKVMWYVQAGQALYILDNDNLSDITLWNIVPVTIEAKTLNGGATFDHAALLGQYQAGGFSTAGLVITQSPGPNNGTVYHLDRTGSGKFGFTLGF
jgi:hypothetical protein